MKISCNKQKLVENINTVQKAVASKSTLPILECIYIGTHQGKLRMIANDLNLAIEATEIPCFIDEEGSVALSARLFSDIVRNLPDGEILISGDSRNVTVISSGKTEFKILGLPGDEFPFPTDVEKKCSFALSCNDIKDMVKQTVFAVSDDDSKQTMTGELLKFEGNTVTMAALDGFRIAVSKREYPNFSGDAKAIIPFKTLSELTKILPGDKEKAVIIYFSDKHALFECENCKVVTRLIEGDFVNYENIFKTEATTVMRVSRAELCLSVERAMLITTDQKKSPVKFNIRQNTLILTSFADTGAVYEELNIRVEGNQLEIGFNPKFLVDVLKVIEEEEIMIEFTTALSQCIIKTEEDDKYKFLVLPLRLKS